MRIRVFGTLLATVALGSGAAWAQGGHDGGHGGMGDGHHGSCDPDEAVASPILSAGDFNADGRVTGWDYSRIKAAVKAGEYIAIMDRDADGDLDWDDVAAVKAEKKAKATSTELDRQLVAVVAATNRYQDINNAIADGYRPFTQPLAGHGYHWARVPLQADPTSPTGLNPSYENILDENVDILEPEGLNYDENGNLRAVFYYHGVDVLDWVIANWTNNNAAIAASVMRQMMLTTHLPKPDVFADTHHSAHQEMWHTHFGACFDGIDYIAMTFDVTIVPTFYQPLTDVECFLTAAQSQGTYDPDLGWLAGFNMMHAWVHSINVCGVFAGTDPHLLPDAQPEPFLFSFEEWYAKQFLGL